MRKIIFVSMMVAVAITSCTKDNNDSKAEEEAGAEYTIMVYGCGGGDLDDQRHLNFCEVEAMGYQEDVQFTAMFKYSTSWQGADEAFEGTRLLTMETSGEMSNTKVGDADLRLDDPQNLADFIIDAKLRLPAKKYILILDNHGSGFDIRDQLVETSYTTKGVCFDDNTDDSSISIFEIDAALETVGEKIDMLYWNACLMNAIENNYQIRDHFDYIMGSNHSSYISSYSILINGLMVSDDIVSAGKYYTKKLIAMWDELLAGTAYYDIALIQCDKIDRVVELIGDACDLLCDYRDNLVEGSIEELRYQYTNGDSSEDAKEYYYESEYYSETLPRFYYTEGGVHYYYDGWVDMMDLSRSLRLFGVVFGYAELSALSTIFNDAVDDMYLAREYTLPSMLSETGISVTWLSDVVYNAKYEYDDLTIQSLAELYPYLDFDKATGWGSKFLAGNVMRAVGDDEEKEELYYLTRE